MTGRNVIYYRHHAETDRWLPGDRHLRGPIRRLLRGQDRVGGLDLVYLNLCEGLRRAGIPFETNLPFDELRPDDKVGVIGRDRQSLEGYHAKNRILAGVSVAQHPAEWPELFEDHPVSRYVVHCDWVKRMYEQVYGPRVVTWAVGIDTSYWAPEEEETKDIDLLVYDKVRWDHDRVHAAMVDPIKSHLAARNISTINLRYGHYKPEDLKDALRRCRALLFLCEHETQGLAYQQAMSAGLPVLAWDPGQWLDPWRFRYGTISMPATSVPFFDQRCGTTFKSLADFEGKFEEFWSDQSALLYRPRDYVLENLGIELCAHRYIELLEQYTGSGTDA